MAKKYYLMKYNDNWADEIDIDGISVFDEDSYKSFMEEVEYAKKNKLNFEFSIGTNEDIEINGKYVENCFEITEITKEEHDVLSKLGITYLGFADNFINALSDAVVDHQGSDDEDEDD